MGNRLMQLNTGEGFSTRKSAKTKCVEPFDCHHFCVSMLHLRMGEIKNDCGFARDNVKLYFDVAEEKG